jgi:hypothetical protein
MLAEAAEPGDQRRPDAGERGDVDPVGAVVLEVPQIHLGGLVDIVVGELQLADLGGGHRLDGGRQRRVTYRPPLVVVDVARLVLVVEAVAEPVLGQQQVGLLDHLAAVQVEVGRVQQQRVLVAGGLEVPLRQPGEPFVLLVDAQAAVVGDGDRVGRLPPGRHLLDGDAEAAGQLGVAVRGLGRAEQVVGGEVGEQVVLDDGAVLVRPGDPDDVPGAVDVAVPQRHPQPGRLDQQLQPDLDLERLVTGDRPVAGHRGGDVGVDVERGRAGRPVAGALLAMDGAPGERGAAQPQGGGPLLGQVQGGVPPAQGVGGGLRLGVGQHRQHVGLGVPEGVPVVAGAGQPLGGQAAALPRAPVWRTWNSANRTACWTSGSPSTRTSAPSQNSSR